MSAMELGRTHRSAALRRNSRGRIATAAIFGYLLGLFPSADLAQRHSRAGIDLRKEGSGNPGATNVDKLLGHKWGAVVLAADVTKGALAARAGGVLCGELGANVAGTSAVLGHCFRYFGRSRGGKGVATRYGQLMVTDPRYFFVDFLVAFLVGRLTKRGAIALVTAVLSSAVMAVFTVLGRQRPLRAGRSSMTTAVATLLSGAAVLLRFHQERGRPDELRRVQKQPA